MILVHFDLTDKMQLLSVVHIMELPLLLIWHPKAAGGEKDQVLSGDLDCTGNIPINKQSVAKDNNINTIV